MYRKPATPGVLVGVVSGPYTDGKKLVDAGKLPPAARQRLADVLGGRTEPIPILHEHPSRLSSRFRASWGALAGVLALTTLTAIGFADPRAAWAYQPAGLVVGYVAASMLVAFSLVAIYRRRALASGGALVPGRYLLPLDVVEVPAEDPSGDQVLVVTPLGDARDARIRKRGRNGELFLVLDGGAEVVFTLRTEREGEDALRRLEQSQLLLEELTYVGDVDKARANDAFFDVRAGASWGSLTPSAPGSGAARRRRAFLHGRLATAAALLVSAGVGQGAFVGRNFASDRALYLHALRVGTTESLEAYLVRGTSYRKEANALRDKLAHTTVPEAGAQRSETFGACITRVRARASTGHRDVTPILEALIARARRNGDPVIPVRVDTRMGQRPAAARESDHAARATRTIAAFEQMFSETCPASLVRFEERPAAARGSVDVGAPGVDVRIEITWPLAPTWTRAGTAVHAPTFVFDITLRGEAINDVASFHLAVPPPAAPPTAVRERSLFVLLPEDAAPDPAYALLSARAFDLLYDDLRGRF